MKKLTLLLSLCALCACKKEEEKPITKTIIVQAYSKNAPFVALLTIEGQNSKGFRETISSNSFYREIEVELRDAPAKNGCEFTISNVNQTVNDSLHCSISSGSLRDENAKAFSNTVYNLSAKIELVE
jgi:hypothetical protein